MERLNEAINRTGDPADLQEFYRTADLKDP
jgi:hypothetical protein